VRARRTPVLQECAAGADGDKAMRQLAHRALALAQIAAGVALAAFAVHAVLPDSGRVAWLFDYVVYYAIVVGAAVFVTLRAALVRGHRWGWAVMSLALWLYVAAEFVWLAFIGNDPNAPYPSVADYLWLSFYPAAYVALVLLFRSRFTGITSGLWIDGLTAALAAATLGSAVLLEEMLKLTEGSTATVATGLAYPLGDVVLLSLVIAAFALTAWRPGRVWWLLGLSLLVFAVGDSIYLYTSAKGTYVEGRLLDLTWPAALLFIAVASWQDTYAARRIDIRGRSLLAVPSVCAVIAAGVLTVDHFARLNLLAIVLALGTLVCVLVRLGLAFRENGRLLQLTRSEAITDALTGLGNRRLLLRDLEQALDPAHASTALLVIYDLDGFKGYNDTFGHPAGDALLGRLGRKLEATVAGHGQAYRLGGDEFCLLAEVDGGQIGELLEQTIVALTESGEGFEIGCSFGAVVLPEEAEHPEGALRLADERLYGQKHGKRTERDRPHELLLAALYEREPGLHTHLQGVVDLATQTARVLGLSDAKIDELRRAAQLHDIGKISIPDQILYKNGPLDEEEWVFVRQHSVVGERILTASPALRSLGPIVRSTHERWDGTGYPDGLAGEEIPVASRIIAACDAYAAMTVPRAHRPALPHNEALEQLQANAGTQFDPAVVDALVASIRLRARSLAA
jgi:diguanylate cyclase (GGDEF)-like protein